MGASMRRCTLTCSLLFVAMLQALTGCTAPSAPAARVTWVVIDLQAGTDHPAARRLRELEAAAGPNATLGRDLKLGELSVLLDQITRDGVGRPLAYISLGLGGAPSEARSYSSRAASREPRSSGMGALLLMEARPVPKHPSQFIIALRDMQGSTDAFQGGSTGKKIDLDRDIGRIIGGGHGWGGASESLQLLVVEPVTPQTPELDFTPDEVMPSRDD